MKKTATFIGTAILIGITFSCGKKGDDDSKNPESELIPEGQVPGNPTVSGDSKNKISRNTLSYERSINGFRTSGIFFAAQVSGSRIIGWKSLTIKNRDGSTSDITASVKGSETEKGNGVTKEVLKRFGYFDNKPEAELNQTLEDTKNSFYFYFRPIPSALLNAKEQNLDITVTFTLENGGEVAASY